MTRPDRFGLQGDPDIRRARRVQFGSGPFGVVLLAVLALLAAAQLFTVESWPGYVGTGLSLSCAALGLRHWQRLRAHPDLTRNPPLFWYVGGVLSLTLWDRLDRFPASPAVGEVAWTATVTLAGVLLPLWLSSRRGER